MINFCRIPKLKHLDFFQPGMNIEILENFSSYLRSENNKLESLSI